MSVTPTRLYHGKPAAAGTDIYTAPAGGMVVLQVLATNTTGGAGQITLELDPAGAPTPQFVLNAKGVAANDAYPLRVFIPMAAGDKLRATNSAGDPIALLVSGITPS